MTSHNEVSGLEFNAPNVLNTSNASDASHRNGCIGDKLILDRGPSGNVRMRVALSGAGGAGEHDPFRGLVAAPTPPRPMTLKEELASRRARQPPVDEVSVHVMEYLWNRYGDCISVDERCLKRSIASYLEKFTGSGWSGNPCLDSDAEC